MPFFATLSAAPAFAGRAFLTMFVIALFGRYGTELPLLTDGVIESLRALPSWFTGYTSLIILGVLALIEIFADKIPEAREAMSFVDEYIKPTASAFIALQLLKPEFGVVIAPALGMANLGIGVAFTPLAIVFALIAGGITWAITTTRNRLLEPINEIDSSGETGLGTIISWLTDAGSLLFVTVAIVAPVIGFILLIIALIALGIVRWMLVRRERAREVTCLKCNTRHSVVALQCPSCQSPHEASKLAFFGLAVTDEKVTDIQSHRFELLKWRRCPCCAEKLPSRALQQTCSRCSTQTFDSKESARVYLSYIERCFSNAIVPIALMGLIPIVGLIFGVIYGRLQVTSGLRLYLGLFASWGGRIAVAIASFVLLWFQAVPFFGALAISAMVAVSFTFFRSRFRNQIDRTFS